MTRTITDAIKAEATQEQYHDMATKLFELIKPAFEEGSYTHMKTNLGTPGFISIRLSTQETVDTIKEVQPVFNTLNMDMNDFNLVVQDLFYNYFELGDSDIDVIAYEVPANPKSILSPLTGFDNISNSQGEVAFNIVYVDETTKEDYEKGINDKHGKVIYLTEDKEKADKS